MPGIIAALVILALCALYLLTLRGRANHPGMDPLRGWYYAHRGLHGDGVPENSMAAFRQALQNGYGIELDIHLMRDGNLAVIHDASLNRTAGADVFIEDLTAEELPGYHLGETEQTIPLFSDVLALFGGQAPMIVELKVERNNVDALCTAACAMLDGYDGAYCIESFDPRCILWLKKHRPDIIRGQLAENWFASSLKINWLLKWLLTCCTGNFMIRPDFIAYRFADRQRLGTTLCRKIWGVTGVSWTLRSKDEFDTAVKEGWIPIFEGFRP